LLETIEKPASGAKALVEFAALAARDPEGAPVVPLTKPARRDLVFRLSLFIAAHNRAALSRGFHYTGCGLLRTPGIEPIREHAFEIASDWSDNGSRQSEGTQLTGFPPGGEEGATCLDRPRVF